MTIRFQDKQPTESVVVEFDFGDDVAATPAPTLAVVASDGTADPNPDAIKSGVLSIDGTKVLQRLAGGVSGVDYFFRCTGTTTSGDVLTVEAQMLVLERPIAHSIAARYITRAQFEHRFGEQELTDLEEDGNAYGQAENEAASLIDGFLATRYSLPLASIPSIVVGWAADITRHKLWDERAPLEVEKRYETALKQLEMLSKGLIALPPDAGGVPVPTTEVAFSGYRACRVFDEETLRYF